GVVHLRGRGAALGLAGLRLRLPVGDRSLSALPAERLTAPAVHTAKLTDERYAEVDGFGARAKNGLVPTTAGGGAARWPIASRPSTSILSNASAGRSTSGWSAWAWRSSS